MKKLILVMFAAMFLCNISYGATIKELLDGQKSLKLSCTVDTSVGKWFGFGENEIADLKWEGLKYLFEIQKKEFSITQQTEKHDFFIGYTEAKYKDKVAWIYDVSIEINDETIYFLAKGYPPKNKNNNNIQLGVIEFGEDAIREINDIKINRLTGAFSYSKQSWGLGLIYSVGGQCEKVTENKF